MTTIQKYFKALVDVLWVLFHAESLMAYGCIAWGILFVWWNYYTDLYTPLNWFRKLFGVVMIFGSAIMLILHVLQKRFLQ